MKINNKRSKTNHFNQKGITLIALVITIVVLLILAGVSINAIFSENGIINKAKDVQTKTDQATESDLDAINGLNEWINDKTGQTTPNEPISRNGKIPNGATYTKSDGTVLEGNGTNEFPDTPANEDIYEEGDYKYTCKINGWSVIAKDKTKTTYGKILSKIAEMPIVDMRNTFDSCDSLTTAPVIPSSVTTMNQTFIWCSSLTTAPAIPSGVTDMFETFCGCSSLITAPVIPSGVKNMLETFYWCSSLTTAPAIPEGITNMYMTFSGCSSLTTAPVIPSSVTSMDETFSGCSSLTTAPVIPSSVTSMDSTFLSCKRLTGTIEVNANPTSYTDCFKETQISEITGSTTLKNELLATR